MIFNITQLSGLFKDTNDMLHIVVHEGTVASGTHSLLTNLDFESSGHTGFCSLEDLATVSGVLQDSIDNITISGGGMEVHDNTYHLEEYATVDELTTVSGYLQGQITGGLAIHDNTYHSEVYATEDYVDTAVSGVDVTEQLTTLSGALQDQIDDKADVTHNHDGVYQPAGDYATSAELTSVSGAIVSQIPTDYFTQSEITTISGNIVAQIPVDYYTTGEVDALVASASGTTDHSALDNLDYASSGHTGFQPAGEYITSSELTTVSGIIVDQIPTDYYTTSEVDTISGSLQDQIDNIDPLPDQTGNSGKYLTTDGSSASWATVSGGGGGDLVDDTTPQLGGDLDLNEYYIEYTPVPASDLTGSGEMMVFEVYSNAIGPGGLLYNATSGRCSPAKADSTMTLPCVFLALESGAGAGVYKKVLLKGIFRDDSWSWTPGNILYVSDSTAGGITDTPPSDSASHVQIIGFALSATTIYFNPQYITVEIA